MNETQPKIAGLFAGIGGIELGFERAGFETVGLCEVDEAGRSVLKHHFDLAPNQFWKDVTRLKQVPRVDLLTAGFPCQDLSQAGRKSGIEGSQSSLVSHVFRLIDRGHIENVLLENVSYMLRLDKGQAMAFLVQQFEQRKFKWAYRVVDARSFGVPQRRQRVVFLASRTIDPSTVLFADDAEDPNWNDAVGDTDMSASYGFYWTEGLRGLGWTKNAVPTVKGGSRIGIPSPPAIWVPRTGEVGTPSIEDAERLQGFRRGWTEPAEDAGHRRGARWHLVGNAVCVPMSEWVAQRFLKPGEVVRDKVPILGSRWPDAACGAPGAQTMAVGVSNKVFDRAFAIDTFVEKPLKPLSAKATRGFLSRAERGGLRFSDGFLHSLYEHLAAQEEAERVAA